MKKKDPRTSDTTTLKEGFSNLLNKYNLETKFDEHHLINSWSRLLGDPVGNRTEKIFIKEKKLFVKLSSSPLRQELSMSKSKILELFHKEFGHTIVEDIVFL